MLELLSSGLLSVWLQAAGMPENPLDPLELAAWQNVPGMAIANHPDPDTEEVLQQYLKDLTAKGMIRNGQGIWLQSGYRVLTSNQGTVPLPAASLTKVATSLASLVTWGPHHEFETQIFATGPIQNGVLQGDLIIKGGNDPLFVWEEAIATANSLNQLGISRVTGNLIVTENFFMNADPSPATSGELFRQAVDSRLWTEDIKMLYYRMAPGTPKPSLAIAGTVVLANPKTTNHNLLLRHRSLPLADILREMNIYSDNDIAQMLADALGGHQVVKRLATSAAGVPPNEILLINGSGLGQENRISPRAACAMFMAIHRYLEPYQINLAHLFPISGLDQGTLEDRQIPAAAIVKTGTLWDVSALAGVLPTRDRGLVWFAIINRGEDVYGFRDQQDELLKTLRQKFGTSVATPIAITRTPTHNSKDTRIGAAGRNEIFSDVQALKE